jgi:uncharacterized protein (TIGR02145 family)
MNKEAYWKLYIGRLLNYILMTGFLSVLVSGCKDDDEPATVKDIDGNVYKTIKIGSQVWMAENLRVTHYRNGDPIPLITNSITWGGRTAGAYCYPNGKQSNVEEYGLLYNSFTVSDSRNMAPKGWHVPTDAEWQQLIDFFGEEAYQELQQEDGFSPKRAGIRYPEEGVFYNMDFGVAAYWWTASIDDNMYPLYWGMYNSIFHSSTSWKAAGLSVRCVKD